jgi:hypothetical protein
MIRHKSVAKNVNVIVCVIDAVIVILHVSGERYRGRDRPVDG